MTPGRHRGSDALGDLALQTNVVNGFMRRFSVERVEPSKELSDNALKKASQLLKDQKTGVLLLLVLKNFGGKGREPGTEVNIKKIVKIGHGETDWHEQQGACGTFTCGPDHIATAAVSTVAREYIGLREGEKLFLSSAL